MMTTVPSTDIGMNIDSALFIARLVQLLSHDVMVHVLVITGGI